MYDVAQLKSGLLGSTPLISWRQTPNPAEMQLTGNLIATPTSGMYFNDFHPLLTSTGLKSIAPNFDLYTYNAWSALTAYVVGDIVTVSSIRYICILGHTNHTPPNATYWEVYTPFSGWLREKTEAGIVQAIDTWLNTKFQNKTARNLLERNTLFRSAVSSRGKDTNEEKFVGFEFVPMRTAGTVMKITSVSVQFDEDCDFVLYLYQSNIATPIYAETINYTGGGGLQWITVDWTLTGDGSWLVGYDQAEIPTIQSINGVPDFTHVSGGGHWLPIGKFFNAAAFEAEPYSTVGIPDMEIGNDFIVGGSKAFGSEDLAYSWETNYGLNFKFSVQCDYTAMVLEQKNLFKQVIGLQVAINLLNEHLFNADARVNRHESNAADKGLRIAYELDGDSASLKKSGLRHLLNEAMEAIQFDETNIDPACLPCARKGIRFDVI